jgi:hypothetical protein
MLLAVIARINYGYNIVVVSDLSNRIVNDRAYDDPQILALITAKLRTLFQKSADLGMNGKFFFTTINKNDFKNFTHNDSIFKINLTHFKTDVIERSNYLHHNIGRNSLDYDINILNREFKRMYDGLKSQKQLPADTWYYLRDELSYPVIDTSSTSYPYQGITVTNKYKNYIILLTDGYIEADRYGDNKNMVDKNQFRFFSGETIKRFRSKFVLSKSKSLKEFFSDNHYGIMPVQNELLHDSKLLILELYDRSVKNGVHTETPTDLEIMQMFWKDWLLKSSISLSNISMYETFSNKQNLDEVIDRFLELR